MASRQDPPPKFDAPTMADAEAALARHFGYASFRPGQAEVIRAVLAGRDALAVMPTGAGKSVCYQVPAALMCGLTIVVSPLISLMGDQVSGLREAGIRGSYLNSSLTPRQQAVVMARALDGWYDLMYVAPERLADPAFRAFAAQARVPLVAVDEAHCVSQWGQDFRPAYTGIADFVASLPARPSWRSPQRRRSACGATWSRSSAFGTRRSRSPASTGPTSASQASSSSQGSARAGCAPTPPRTRTSPASCMPPRARRWTSLPRRCATPAWPPCPTTPATRRTPARRPSAAS